MSLERSCYFLSFTTQLRNLAESKLESRDVRDHISDLDCALFVWKKWRFHWLRLDDANDWPNS